MSLASKGTYLSACTECNGAGERKGIWSVVVCPGCNGLGEVRSDNGQPLDDYQIINRLRERNRQLILRMQDIQKHLDNPPPTDQEIKRKHYGVRAS